MPLHLLHLTGVLGSLPFNPAASCKKEKKALDQRYHAASPARERFFVRQLRHDDGHFFDSRPSRARRRHTPCALCLPRAHFIG